MAGNTITFPPGDIAAQIAALLPGLIPIRQGITKFTRTVGVATTAGDAEFTSIQAANDAVAPLVSIATGALAAIMAGPGLYLEDVILSEGVHLIGVDGEPVFIGGSTAVGGHMCTVPGYSSIQNITFLAAQVAKASAVRLITALAVPLLVDPRNIRGINIYGGLPNAITSAIRNDVVAAGIPLFMIDELVDSASVNAIETTVGSTANLTIRASKLTMDVLLDGSGEVEFIGSTQISSADIIVNVDNTWKPAGSPHGPIIGTSTDPYVAGNALADINQFVYRNPTTGFGFGANTQGDDVIEDFAVRDKYPMPYFPGTPSVGEFIAGSATEGYSPGNAGIYRSAEIKCKTAPVGADFIIKIHDLDGSTDRKLTVPAGSSFVEQATVVPFIGAPTQSTLPQRFSMEATQQGSTIPAGDIDVSFNAE